MIQFIAKGFRFQFGALRRTRDGLKILMEFFL